MQRHASQGNTTTPIVHQTPPARRPIEVAAIDMPEIWASQQVENAKWIMLYGALIQGAMAGAFAAPPSKEGEKVSDTIDLDYEALAQEADHAYSRYAARVRNQR